MKRYFVLAISLVTLLSPTAAQAVNFNFNTGTYNWNDTNNWAGGTVPNGSGASATILGPNTTTGDDLSIALDVGVTLGTLDIQKPTGTNVNGDTSITGANTLTMAGGSPSSITNRASAANTGTTTIGAPISIGTTLTVNQESNDLLLLNGAISGGTGLTIARTGTGGGGARTVVLGTTNTYGGNTTLIGSTNNNNNFLIVRLVNADSIPAASNITSSTGSVVLEASGNFQRTIGTGTALQFAGGSTRNGWGAVGGDLSISLNAGASITWSLSTWNELVLGTNNSTNTAIMTNPIVLNGSATRVVRTFNGSGLIDGKFSGVISGAQNLQKEEDGALSLANANLYTGNTLVVGGLLRLDHQNALAANSGFIQINTGATLGIGADTVPGDPNVDFARDLGAGVGQIQLVAGSGTNNNTANGGFSAHDANRTVTLSSGATINWGEGFFLAGGTGTPSRNLILSDDTANATLKFTNPLNLGAGNVNLGLDSSGLTVTRNAVVRNGTAEIDAVLSGVLSGTSSFTKDNTGTLVLTANNSYSGGTVVERGRLLVNNVPDPMNPTFSGTGTGAVTVKTTTTLGGIGTVNGAVTAQSGATIAPGIPGIGADNDGILNVGSASLLAGSTLNIELGGTSFPSGFDRLSSDLGAISIDMTGVGATLNVSLINGFMPAPMNVFHIVTAGGGLSGEFTTHNLPTLPDTHWDIDYQPNFLQITLVADVTNDADFNDDGVVDSRDYVIWRKFDGTTGTGTPTTGDADGDHNVNSTDYGLWVQQYGNVLSGSGGGNNGATPEPSSLVLAAIAMLFARRRKR